MPKLPQFHPTVYPVLDIVYEIGVLYLLYQITLPGTAARKAWEVVTWTHLLLIMVTKFHPDSILAANPLAFAPLYWMFLYDLVMFTILFAASAFGYLDGLTDFAGLSGKQWSVFFLCNAPLNMLNLQTVEQSMKTSLDVKKSK